MADEAWIEAREEGAALALAAGGRWLVSSAAVLDRRLTSLGDAMPPRASRTIRIDCAQIAALDTVGAWLVLRLKAALGQKGAHVSIENLAPRFAPLLTQAEKFRPVMPSARPARYRGEGPVGWLARFGALVLGALDHIVDMLGFFGQLSLSVWDVMRHPRRFRFISFVSHVQRTGVTALPIVGLLSFLIGIVIAYQGAAQLRYYGAEIFTVNLLGVGYLRELGVLMTSIIVAGRSGSSFTAEIGTMRVNEEVDAMTTIGLDPVEVLVLPRLAALVVSLPLLTFYANMTGLIGGAVICDTALGIPLPLFLQQLRPAIVGWTFWLGILKAPFFAICIAMIGCREGLRVGRSAESVGRLTTLSVVESIFLVIVFDAAFSIVFSQLGI
jgi:phospholipid/cholesterol/gamma-HCH transport system permease protein